MQRLFDRIKDRKEIQLVTFNVDDNVGAIAPFMKENNYTFPVVPAQFLIDDLVPALGIPLNWIVNVKGVVVLEKGGFSGDGDKWIEDAIATLEKARAGT